MSVRFYIHELFQKSVRGEGKKSSWNMPGKAQNYHFLTMTFSNFCSIFEMFQDNFCLRPSYFFLEPFMYAEPNGRQFLLMSVFLWLCCWAVCWKMAWFSSDTCIQYSASSSCTTLSCSHGVRSVLVWCVNNWAPTLLSRICSWAFLTDWKHKVCFRGLIRNFWLVV